MNRLRAREVFQIKAQLAEEIIRQIILQRNGRQGSLGVVVYIKLTDYCKWYLMHCQRSASPTVPLSPTTLDYFPKE